MTRSPTTEQAEAARPAERCDPADLCPVCRTEAERRRAEVDGLIRRLKAAREATR
jgi:hypothetical protein